MPDPTGAARFVMISTPNIPQPYQERFLTALENSSRPETSSERWNRERNESLKTWNGAIRDYATAATDMPAAFDRNYTCQPTPIIGRKRAKRRARGRRVEAKRLYGSAALALAAAFRADAKRAAAVRQAYADWLAANFTRQAEPLMEPSRSISSDDLSKQLAEAAWSCTPLFRPRGPRPGQACLYSGGEVFYVDPVVLDRLESGLFMEYSLTPAQEVNKVNHDLAAAMFACPIERPSPYSFNACC